MEILNTKEEVIEAISKSNLQPKNSLTSTNYGDHVTFQCSCNETHAVNDTSNQVFAIAMPVKFCLSPLRSSISLETIIFLYCNT